ncbi:MAG: hypothetical protein R3B49_02755 [Phycisphaerales bacterium]
MLRLTDVSSTEMDPMSKTAVISELPEQKKIEGLGGRCGWRAGRRSPRTPALPRRRRAGFIRERFRHRYEVDPADRAARGGGWCSAGVTRRSRSCRCLSGRGAGRERGPRDADAPVLHRPQFHPELTSRPPRPQPMFAGLIADPAPVLGRGGPVGGDDPRNRARRWLRRPNSTAQTV